MKAFSYLILLLLCSSAVKAENNEAGEALGLLIESQSEEVLIMSAYENSKHINALMGVYDLIEKNEIDKAKEMLQQFTLLEVHTMFKSLKRYDEFPLAQNTYIELLNQDRSSILKAGAYLTPERAKEAWGLKEAWDFVNKNNPIEEIPEETINKRRKELKKATDTLLKHRE